MIAVQLFAWAVPAYFKGSVVDHTWVTTYDNRLNFYNSVADVVAAGEHYWFSWGIYRSAGATPVIPDGFLAAQSGDVPYARCLCKPDVDSGLDHAARGTVFRYGRDGVCHQLANQILWATALAAPRPATVRKARGYWVSNALFGPYGTRHTAWAMKKRSCSNLSGDDVMSPDVDDFQQHLRSVLTGQQAEKKIQALMRRRSAFMERVERMQALPDERAPSASQLNEMYSSFLREAAHILGDHDFELVFGESPQEEMNIVDPAIYEAESMHARS
ncbi:hypothetical protein BLA14095_03710 [Burkholderia lata]|uniref:hypothetical protein n=1 Tax=Burkholderia lata (strain ATCC 17760 / DSM 23089 / LMG 22485 / NCIMB 9086 / R18194 / 383) TaxID=482957 RepID=UPI0014535672|nr:hypothetical protein [Burkholderia lata]VWB80375.1 hypothetical protein BLA14095_03710 [Burkholderia lata]